MKRRTVLSSSVVAIALSVGTLAAITTLPSPAEAQYAPPPVEVVATLTPVYHEGRAVYGYNGYWHYRERGAWAYYHEEPAFLREWRRTHHVYWHHYGRR
jgi:hypothetical protein